MRIFFILALGRSGTNFLSSLLGGDTRGVVHHEPYPLDWHMHVLRHSGRFDQTLDGLMEARFEKMLPEEGSVEFYGEVNSFLRYEANWLRKRFDPTLVHLVRDGRDFVRSAYIRPVYTPLEDDGPILPKDGSEWAERWPKSSRFQKLCWYWTHSNQVLADSCENLARFEDLLRDYDEFDRRILGPTGVRVSREAWEREIARPKNTSRQYRMKQTVRKWLTGAKPEISFEPLPRWERWDPELTGQFWEICGPTMERLGYPRN